MAQISVEKQAAGSFRVEVRDKGAETTHIVSVPVGLASALGADDLPSEVLIEESFRFLLEREPSTSIMRKFSLDVIGQYFPEYKGTLRDRISKRDEKG